MAEQYPHEKPELRLALGMRGGVSLAVWIGGACAEIDALRRAAPGDGSFWGEVLERSPYKRVVVDVMAGASAGGLNGVLFAAAIRHRFGMEELGDVWSRVAAVDDLRRQSPPWLSLFDGDRSFLDVIRGALDELVADAVKRHGSSTGDGTYVDLQLSATLVEPVEQPATSPRDEKLRRRRSDARFHFRHDPSAALPRRDLERQCIPQLAVAARATASFPGAFEAAVVRSARPPNFRSVPKVPAREAQASAASERLADCHGFFSESHRQVGDPTAFADDDFLVADGGVVDNIPLGKALDAIRDASADGPTKRVLVYLHPTGPATAPAPVEDAATETNDEKAIRRRGPVAVARGLMAAKLERESIDGDLERIEEHNHRVRLGALLRQSLLEELAAPDAVPATALARTRCAFYAVQRGGADADSVHRLLRDPVVLLGEDPFPSVAAGDQSEDRWRSPMWCWGDDLRESINLNIRTHLTARLTVAGAGPKLLLTGLGPLARSLRLLIELVRSGETSDRKASNRASLGQVKKRLYELVSLVQSMDRVRRIGWVVAAGARPRSGNQVWIDSTLEGLDCLLRWDPDEAIAILAGRAQTGVHEARDAYFAHGDEVLHAWALGTAPVKPDGPSKDLREVLPAHLLPIVSELLQLLGQPSPVPTTRAREDLETARAGQVIQQVLLDVEGGEPPATADALAERLAALEVLLVHEQLLGNPGASEIRFERMSAAAMTADAPRFQKLWSRSKALDAKYTDGEHLLPNVKLAGNELGSFSAFLDRSWRVNDWTWGRMDAVPTLVDLLLGLDLLDPPAAAKYAGIAPVAASTATNEAEIRLALIRRRQDEIFRDAVENSEDLPPTRDNWDAGIKDLTHPGSTALARSVRDLGDVAGSVIGAALPPTVPRVTPQLRAVLRRLAKRFAKPRGGYPPLPGADPPVVQTKSRLLPPVAVLIGLAVAAMVWAIAASIPAFLIGVAVGILPGGLLLWLAVQRKPKKFREQRSSSGGVPRPPPRRHGAHRHHAAGPDG